MSTDIKRISVEEGVALFERTGLTPKPGMYYCKIGGQSCACLVGAFVIDAQGVAEADSAYRENESWMAGQLAVELGLNRRYVSGLVDGFDGADLFRGGDDAYRLGFADGAAIRQRVLPVEGGAA